MTYPKKLLLPLVYIFLSASFCVLLYPLLQKRLKQIPCDIQQFPFTGAINKIQCYKDNVNRSWYKLRRDSPLDSENEIVLKPEAFPDGVLIEAFSLEKTPVMLRLGSLEPTPKEPFNSRDDGERIVLRAEFSKDTVTQGIAILPVIHLGKAIFFNLRPQAVNDNSQSKHFLPSVEMGASRYWIWITTIILLITGVLTTVIYVKAKKPSWGVIAIIFTFILAFLYHERPYRGMNGYIDFHDDTYYVAYAQSLINHGTPFSCNENISYSRMATPCHGLPGTGIALLPGVLLAGLFFNEPIFGAISIPKLRGMRIISMLYGLGGCLLLFFSMHLFSTSWLNVILAGMLIWGTSLSKWVFDRAIFSHSVEMFFLCAILFSAVLVYQHKISKTIGASVLGLLSAIVIFVRGEYQIFVYLFPLFWFAAGNGRKTWRYLLIFYLCTIPTLIVYQHMSHYIQDYTSLKTNLIISSFTDVFGFIFWEKFSEHGQLVIANFFESGLMLYLGFLSVFSLCHKKNNLLLFRSLLLFFIIYLVATLLFRRPLGDEWQHRYFLKLYPLAFLAIVVCYHRHYHVGKTVIIAALIFSLIKQRLAFNENVLNNALEKYEPVYRYLTDSHLHAHGYEHEFFLNYSTLLLILALTGGWQFWHLHKLKKKFSNKQSDA